MYKGLWITVNQANRWTRSLFWGSVWSPTNFMEELRTPREVLIKAGCAKNVRKEHKIKNACGYKMPTQNHSVRSRWKEKAIKSSWGRAQSWWRPWRAWVARVECRWHGKRPWKTKWRTTLKWNDNKHHKNLLEVLPSNYHRWEFLSPNSAKCLIQNQNKIFLILPLIRYQILPLFFLNLNLNMNLNLISFSVYKFRHLWFLYSIFTLF